MHKKSIYNLMIATALTMTSSTTYTMLTEWCRKGEQKPEQLKFKTADDISSTTKMHCAGLGFLAGCAQQGWCVAVPLDPETYRLSVEGGMFVAALCMKMQCKYIINGLHKQTDAVIDRVLQEARDTSGYCVPRDHFLVLSERETVFRPIYKGMRSGQDPLDERIVSAHNAILQYSVEIESFAEGYMVGTALGKLSALAYVSMFR